MGIMLFAFLIYSGRFERGWEFFSSPLCPDWLGAHPAYSMGSGGPYTSGKADGA